ncbi:MAG: hypothetical protein WCN87_02695, partial [Chlamydiota bacterium]
TEKTERVAAPIFSQVPAEKSKIFSAKALTGFQRIVDLFWSVISKFFSCFSKPAIHPESPPIQESGTGLPLLKQTDPAKVLAKVLDEEALREQNKASKDKLDQGIQCLKDSNFKEAKKYLGENFFESLSKDEKRLAQAKPYLLAKGANLLQETNYVREKDKAKKDAQIAANVAEAKKYLGENLFKTLAEDKRCLQKATPRLLIEGARLIEAGNLDEAKNFLGENFQALKNNHADILESHNKLPPAIAVGLLESVIDYPGVPALLYKYSAPAVYKGFSRGDKDLEMALSYGGVPLHSPERLGYAQTALRNGKLEDAKLFLGPPKEWGSSDELVMWSEIYKKEGKRAEIVKLDLNSSDPRVIEAYVYAYLEGDSSLPKDVDQGIHFVEYGRLKLPPKESHIIAQRYLERGELDKAFSSLKESKREATAKDYADLGLRFQGQGKDLKGALALAYGIEKGYKDNSNKEYMLDACRAIQSQARQIADPRDKELLERVYTSITGKSLFS